MRTERCACGGWIVCGSKEAVAEVIRQHNQSLLHRLWRWEWECREALDAAQEDGS